MGRYFFEGLTELQRRHPSVVRDVRGRGLMLGMEFTHSDYALMTAAEAGHRGVITFYTLNNPEVIRIEPPLTITPELIDRAVAGLDGAIAEASRVLAPVRAAADGAS